MELDMHTTRTLNNGVRMPVLGLAYPKRRTGQRRYRRSDGRWKPGTGNIDTASCTETRQVWVPEFARAEFPAKRCLSRPNCGTMTSVPGRVREAFEESLCRLGTEYIDLYLIHCRSGENR